MTTQERKARVERVQASLDAARKLMAACRKFWPESKGWWRVSICSDGRVVVSISSPMPWTTERYVNPVPALMRADAEDLVRRLIPKGA